MTSMGKRSADEAAVLEILSRAERFGHDPQRVAQALGLRLGRRDGEDLAFGVRRRWRWSMHFRFDMQLDTTDSMYQLRPNGSPGR